MKAISLVALAALCVCTANLADTLVTKDGREFEGVIKKETVGEVVMEIQRYGAVGAMTFKRDEIARITRKEFTGDAPGPGPNPLSTPAATSQPVAVKLGPASQPATPKHAPWALDTVELTDGRILHGRIVPGDSQTEVAIETPDGTLTFPRNKIKQQRVEPVSAPAATQAEANPVAAPPATQAADPPSKPPVPPDLAALLDKADGETTPAKALLVYERAHGLFPKDLRVPKAMAAHFQDGITLEKDNPNRRLYGRAMAWVLALDLGNPSALNNAGVIDALDQTFAQSINRLGKAAFGDKGDLAAQNLSQAVYMNLYNQEDGHKIVREGWNGWTEAEWTEIVHTVLATMKAQDAPPLRQVIDTLHRQKKHVGDECWGGVWLPADQVAAIRGNNKGPWNDIQEGVRWVKASDARLNIKDMTWEGVKGRKAIYGWILKLKVPDHPGKLVLIDESGGEAKSLLVSCGIQPSEEGLDGSGAPRVIRKRARAVP